MPGKVKDLPDHFQMHHHVHFESPPVSSIEINQNGELRRQKRSSDDIQMLKFPSTRTILWDHKSIDSPVNLHISYYRKPKLCVLERVIRFAQRHLQSSGQQECSCALVGSLSIDEDGEGVKFTLDRFDPGGGLSSSIGALTPGDMAVPLQIMGNTKKDREGSIDDYLMGLKVLKQRCCAKDPVDVGSFLLVKGWCNFYSSGEKSVHHLEFDIITMATEFKATPINPVPIVPTALSKNLSGPMSLSHLQGEPKTGYLTMDHTRKVLLVLESDPKVFNLPLVGIWVSGVPFVYSPFVWAACLRYLHNASITDRICSPPEPFLLILYSPVHSKPEYYEINTVSGTTKMDFDLLTGYEAVSISKSNNPNGTFDVDLNSVKTGQKRDIFDGALHKFNESFSSDEPLPKTTPSTDEITPRLKPAPHKSQLPAVMPMVPEVSLLFGEDGQSGIFTDVGPKRLAINQGKPQGVNHLRDFTPQRPLTKLSSQPSTPAYSQLPPRYSGHSSQQPQRRMPLHSHSAPELNQLYHQNNGMVNRQPRPHSTTGGPPVSGQGVQNYMGNMALSEEELYMPKISQPMPMYQQNGGQGFLHGDVPRGMQQLGPRVPNGYSYPSSQPLPVSQATASHFQQSQQVLNARNMPSSNQVPYSDYQHGPVHSGPIQRMSAPVPQNPQMPNMQGNFQSMSGPYSIPSQPQSQMTQPNLRMVQSGPGGIYQQPVYSQHNGNCQPQSAFVHQPTQEYTTPASRGPVLATAVSNTFTPAPNGQVLVASAVNNGGEIIQPQVKSAAFNPVSGVNVAGQPVQDQRHSTEGDSSKSSDDSGLSFTPEKGNCAKSDVSPQDRAKDNNVPVTIGNSSINWNQVPKEVYQLLIQQDAQLKQLQSQIQMLLHTQSASTQCTTMTDLPVSINMSDSQTKDSTSGPEENQTDKMCSVGVNTTMLYPQTNNKCTVSLQTSPQKSRPQLQHQLSYPHSQSSSEGPHPNSCHSSHHSSCTPSEGSQCSVGNPRQRSFANSEASQCSNDPRTPADIRHRGMFPLNSTEREDEVDVSQGDLTHVMDNMAIHNQTVDSVQSEIIVDLPSYQSSPSRSLTSRDTESNEISKSPLSASMCGGHTGMGGEEDAESEEEYVSEEDKRNTKEYYDKLMDNIHKMLNQHSMEDEGMDSGHVEMTRDTLQQSIMLGQHLSNMQRFDVSGNQVDTTYIPKINYMSMLFDSDSDSSMEINAMAMKYLKDEQLTQMSKAHAQAARAKGTSKGMKENQRLAMLKHVLQNDKDSTPNVTTLGISPNDMTFATRKYMEKHGLLEETGSDSVSSNDTLLNTTYQLKLDYSIATAGSETPAHVTPEIVRHSPFRTVRGNLTPQNRTPSSHNVSGSPFVNKQNIIDKTESPVVNGHNVSDKHIRSPCVESSRKIGTPHSNFTPVTPKGTPNRGVQQFSSPYQVMTPVRTTQKSKEVEKAGQDFIFAECRTPGGQNRVNNETTPVQNHGASRRYPQSHQGYSPSVDNRRVVKGDERVLSPIPHETSPPSTPVQQPKNNEVSNGWCEEDNILDITRLKTLPKLL